LSGFIYEIIWTNTVCVLVLWITMVVVIHTGRSVPMSTAAVCSAGMSERRKG